jgi:hypothetical protein
MAKNSEDPPPKSRSKWQSSVSDRLTGRVPGENFELGHKTGKQLIKEWRKERQKRNKRKPSDLKSAPPVRQKQTLAAGWNNTAAL